MHSILYATGNDVKFRQAVASCGSHGLTLEQVTLDLTEIQAADGEDVARHKAEQAFAQLGKPVAVSDDSWTIPGLKGFPGPYMKYINDWFTPEDWLRLTKHLDDRRVILRQVVVYQQTADSQKVFTVEIPGILLTEIRGASLYAHSTITSFDNGLHSDAEFHAKGESAAQHVHNPWHDFATWYIKEQA